MLDGNLLLGFVIIMFPFICFLVYCLFGSDS